MKQAIDPHRANRIAAVVVTYRSGDRLRELVPVLVREASQVILVDNSSDDGSIDAIADRDDVVIIRNDDNRGFATAANQGAAVASGEWCVFVNPDVRVAPGQLGALVRDPPETAALIAPVQLDEHGHPLPETGGYEPSVVRYLVWALLPTRLHHGHGPWLTPPFPLHDFEADWVSGAILGVRLDAFRSLGGFDERFFLYGEDVDLGMRARRSGFRVVVRPSVRIRHEVAHGDSERRAQSAALAARSMVNLFSGWQTQAYSLTLLIGYGIRAVLGNRAQRRMARLTIPTCWRLLVGAKRGSA